MSESGRFHSVKAGILPLLAVALSLNGCASNTYMGIPFMPGAATPELQHLANLARTGDKRAQLDLGIRYEEGLGIPSNISMAKKLYRLAATDSGGTLWIYSPSVGKDASGRVVPVESGPKRFGLDEARLRVARLESPGK